MNETTKQEAKGEIRMKVRFTKIILFVGLLKFENKYEIIQSGDQYEIIQLYYCLFQWYHETTSIQC